MKKLLLFPVFLSLLIVSCSNDDADQENPQNNQPDNILYIRVDENSLSTYYEMLFNGETIMGTTTPNSSRQHKVINANLLTYFKIQAIHSTHIGINLNNSSYTGELEASRCYELSFATDANGEFIIDELTQINCN